MKVTFGKYCEEFPNVLGYKNAEIHNQVALAKLKEQDKNRYYTLQLLGDFLLDHGGIIFGGYVRDMIIRSYNCEATFPQKVRITPDGQTRTFPSDCSDNNLETIDRPVVPRDIDCFFQKTEKEVLAIYEKIKSLGYRILNYSTDPDYSLFSSIKHHRVHLYPRLPGASRKIVLDILFYKDKDVSDENEFLPPFGNIDMACNALLMKKLPSSKTEIILSPNTGTHLDKLDEKGRATMKHKIIRDIRNFRTEFIGTITPENKNILKGRVKNMRNRGWTVSTEE